MMFQFALIFNEFLCIMFSWRKIDTSLTYIFRLVPIVKDGWLMEQIHSNVIKHLTITIMFIAHHHFHAGAPLLWCMTDMDLARVLLNQNNVSKCILRTGSMKFHFTTVTFTGIRFSRYRDQTFLRWDQGTETQSHPNKIVVGIEIKMKDSSTENVHISPSNIHVGYCCFFLFDNVRSSFVFFAHHFLFSFFFHSQRNSVQHQKKTTKCHKDIHKAYRTLLTFIKNGFQCSDCLKSSLFYDANK